MFYCGFDPDFEAYLASQNLEQDPATAPAGYVAGSIALFLLILLGICAGGLS